MVYKDLIGNSFTFDNQREKFACESGIELGKTNGMIMGIFLGLIIGIALTYYNMKTQPSIPSTPQE